MDSVPDHRPSFTTDNGPPAKRFKGPPEVPAQYSDAVRKKLASTTRTGQACDRCKERKMKCDTNPTACVPCRQKSLRCLTTDRVTGRASERGQSDRLENELQELRRHLAAYHRKHGRLEEKDFQEEYANGADGYANHGQNSQPSYGPDRFKFDPANDDVVEALHTGPINGSLVDLIGDEFDIASFACSDMEEYDPDILNRFNTSKTSMINTMYGAQAISDPQLPSEEEALKSVRHFLTYIFPYMPVVHRQGFLEMTKTYYQDRNSVTRSEEVQIVTVLAIIAHQSAVRNPPAAGDLMEKSNRWLHYALSHFRDLFHDQSLASMQAMTLIMTHFRNLPKPGYSWNFSHKVLVRAIDLNYHRNPDKVSLPKAENNPLAKEFRKRVFWSILGICITTGTKAGRSAPWHFQHVDVPLPMAIQDVELSISGLVTPRSGKCDFWVALRLFKLLPLLTELYNDVISVRRPSNEYLRNVESLDAKITTWRKEWAQDAAVEENGDDAITTDNIRIATLHVDIWAAEFQLALHHPRLDTSGLPEMAERNLDVCHACAKRLLQNFKTLSQKHRGADFTWHTTVAYALAFGVVLYIHNGRKFRASREYFEAMQVELGEWLHVMGLADVVMRTNNFLVQKFGPLVRRLEGEYREVLERSVEVSGQQENDKTALPLQIKSEAATQPHTYMVTHAVDHQQQNSIRATSSYMPTSSYLPHPPLFPDTYQYHQHPVPTQAPAVSYPAFQPPSQNSQQIQYANPPTSLATLLNDTGNMYAPYPSSKAPISSQQHREAETLMGLSASVDSWPDYTDERTFWPSSIHAQMYQPQRP